jgi:capsular polysaccharide transport system permease protein
MAEDRGNASAETVAVSSLEQSRAVAAQLSVTARKLRMSTSNRGKLFKTVGLRPRMATRIARYLTIALTILILIIPNVASTIYYLCFASAQYQSETRFTVRSSTPALGKDQLAKVTGLPAAKIVQDTQIVTNFIDSNDMIDALQKKVDFRQIYGNDTIDHFSRLKADASSEEMLSYWKKTVSTKISPSSGIVTVDVKAFSASDAQKVLTEVVAASEAVVNDVNTRIWQDVITTAKANLENAKNQLQTARENLQKARNSSGVLSVEGSSNVISNLISNVQKERIELQQRYNAQLGMVSADAPQMRVLKREITSKEQQIAQLNQQVAGQGQASANLADVSLDMSQRQLEQTLAEQQFGSSVKTLEQVQFVSRQQLLYLDTFLAPDLADRAEYPKKGLQISIIFGITLAAWAAALGVLAAIRNHFN